MTLEEAEMELKQYTNPPWCMDCKWSIDCAIAKGCGCVTNDSVDTLTASLAFARARYLQAVIKAYEIHKQRLSKHSQ